LSSNRIAGRQNNEKALAEEDQNLEKKQKEQKLTCN
jgi:hypothetical protein